MDYNCGEDAAMPKLSAIRKQAVDGLMKKALFEATVSVLSEHGVDGLTMDSVAAAAGTAKGSLYRYFRSKRDLLEFVYAKLVDPIFQRMEDVIPADQPAVEKLSGQLRVLLEHVAKHAQVHRLLFEDQTAHGLLQSSEQTTFETATRQLTEVFRQGIADGAFRPVDPRMLAVMHLGVIRGVLQSQPELGKPEQRERIHDLIMDALLYGVGAKKG
jgi:AcrR family transcriptional regulator